AWRIHQSTKNWKKAETRSMPKASATTRDTTAIAASPAIPTLTTEAATTPNVLRPVSPQPNEPSVTQLMMEAQMTLAQLHPVVVPHVSHFKQVPFRTIVKLWHSVHWSPV